MGNDLQNKAVLGSASHFTDKKSGLLIVIYAYLKFARVQFIIGEVADGQASGPAGGQKVIAGEV